MSTLSSANDSKCDISKDGKLKPPSLINPPRLLVPTISVTDKTPTPTKLLKAADEIGLFQDVYLSREPNTSKAPCGQSVTIGTGSTIHTTPQSSSTVASANPFEASFATLNRLRTASVSSGVVPLSTISVESEVVEHRTDKCSGDTTLNTPQIFTAKISNDDSINTPQIFPSLQDVVSLPVTPAIQPSLPTAGSSSVKTITTNKQSTISPKSKLRCIAPKDPNCATPISLAKYQNQKSNAVKSVTSAELLIKLPTGEMLPLSKLPVTQERTLGGYVLGSSTNSNDLSIETSSQLDGSTNTNPDDINKDPKQKLKSILEGKPENSFALGKRKKSSDSMISLVQVNHLQEIEKRSDIVDTNHGIVDGFKNTSKKESNKAAARRSRLKKKNAENYNNEMRRKLQEENSKLQIENNILRNEVQRLNAILESHKNCSLPSHVPKEESVQISRMNINVDDLQHSTIAHEYSSPLAIQPSSSSNITSTENKIYKILSLDPIDVNKSHGCAKKVYEKSNKNNVRRQKHIMTMGRPSKAFTSQANVDLDTSQVIDLSFNEIESDVLSDKLHSSRNHTDTNGADILIQAMSHLNEKQSHLNDTNTDPCTSDEYIVHGSPGFVRVTSDSISVSKPLTKKMKYTKKL